MHCFPLWDVHRCFLYSPCPAATVLWGPCHHASVCIYTLHAHTAIHHPHQYLHRDTPQRYSPDLNSEMFSEVQRLIFFCGSDKVLFLPLSAEFGPLQLH